MYNTSLFEDLCRTVDRPRTTGGVRPRQKTPQEIRLLQRRKQYLEKQKEQKEEDKRLIKRHLQNKKKKEDAKFRQMFAKLDKGRELVKSVDEFVELTDSKYAVNIHYTRNLPHPVQNTLRVTNEQGENKKKENISRVAGRGV